MSRNYYYPVFINLSGEQCLVIGGGAVACRKIESLLSCGAVVKVISPEIIPDILRLEEQAHVKVISRAYMEGDLEGAFLVIAATDDVTTNRAVFQEASQRGILVNVVDDPANSNFIVPATLRRGDVSIAVSTSGSSPALARRIKSDLADLIGAEYSDVAELVGRVRRELLGEGISVSPERWQAVLSPRDLADMLKEGNNEEAAALLRRKLLEGS